MNKKIIIWCFIFNFLLIVLFLYLYFDNKIREDNTSFTLKDNLKVNVYSDVNISYFIENIEGKIIEDKKIDTKKIGSKKISFIYLNSRNKKRMGNFKINIVDEEKPLIWLSNSYNVKVGSIDNLTDNIMCADNYDPNPLCIINGEYNLNLVGKYPLTFYAKDNSGNENEVSFTLNVYNETKNKKNNNNNKVTNFNDIVRKYKTDKTLIGIDVSKWQKEIDFKKVKMSGCDFVMIRLGYQDGVEGKYVLDPYFKANIKKANENGIKVGVYFYSYANSIKEAKKQANWVDKQVKNYKLSLPVAFDWECYNKFNSMYLSLFGLSEVSDMFLSTLKSKGYDVMLYGSKNYLNNVWKYNNYDVWLAHYAKETDYKGKYKMWQVCDNGLIDGINGSVDIDILYF